MRFVIYLTQGGERNPNIHIKRHIKIGEEGEWKCEENGPARSQQFRFYF
jgi:hypothetical protein